MDDVDELVLEIEASNEAIDDTRWLTPWPIDDETRIGENVGNTELEEMI